MLAVKIAASGCVFSYAWLAWMLRHDNPLAATAVGRSVPPAGIAYLGIRILLL